MKHTKQLTLFLAVLVVTQSVQAGPIDFIFGAGSFGRRTGTTADCRNVIQRYVENRRFLRDETWRDRVVPVRNPQFLNDLEYLEDTRYASSTLGVVDTKFVEEFDTQIYFTATAKPLPDGTIPVVDPEAKALVVYLHGSGTQKASGVGFAGKMNSLAKMGYSSLSFDMPFHALGSRNPALANAANYAEYMNNIINRYRQPGQRVILVGHSFGPDVIGEYITRFPHGVDSAVMISPGSFDPVTKRWYNEKTSQMDFGDTEMNDAGGRWAGMVTRENTWSTPGAPGRVDPTVANRDLDVYVISGDREEYVPGPLNPATGKPTEDPRTYDIRPVFNNYFSRVDITIEPGVGHYIFNHRDQNGHDVVLRSVLRANGDSLAQERELRRVVTDRMAARPSYDLMALRYSKEPFFRAYVDRLAQAQGKTGMEVVQGFRQADDKRGAQEILTNFMTVERQRVEALNLNIRSTAQWAPDFYNENKAAIDALTEKGDHTTIQAKYLAFLERQPASVVAQHASVPESVFVIPERGPRPGAPSAGGVAVAIPPEMKANIMRDPELKAYVVGHNSSERNDVVTAIATLKVENPNMSNTEILTRLREQRGGN